MSLPEELFVKRLNPDNEKEVCDLLLKFYTIEKTYLKFIKDINQDEVIILNNLRVKQRLQQPYSIGVFTKVSNKLVAISMGYVKKISSSSDKNKDEKQFSEPMKLNFRFLQMLERDIFDQLKVDKVFEMGMGVTHDDYKNQGLMGLTTKLCHHLSKQSGCKYIITKPTTEYVCKHIEKQTPESIINQIYFKDYIDPVTGVNPFTNSKFPFVQGMLTCAEIDPSEQLNMPELESLL